MLSGTTELKHNIKPLAGMKLTNSAFVQFVQLRLQELFTLRQENFLSVYKPVPAEMEAEINNLTIFLNEQQKVVEAEKQKIISKNGCQSCKPNTLKGKIIQSGL